MSNEKNRLEVHKWIVLGIIIVFVLLGSFSGILFPGSSFASIIASSIGRFFNVIDLVKNNYINILESIAIILFIGILYYVLSVIIALITKRNSRGDTIGILITSILRFGAIVLALLMVLSAWNVPTPTILAGAGIAGLAISFGAQGLLEDVFAGLSIIFERQFVVGDFVEVEDFRGIVQQIGPRNTRIKNIYGNVLIVANSDIREIVNFSDDLSFAVSEISVEYGEDLSKVEQILKKHLPLIGEKDDRILADPLFDGVEALADSSVVVRVIAHCEEKDRIDVRRFLNQELKTLFDEQGIKIPFPQLVIHNNKEA